MKKLIALSALVAATTLSLVGPVDAGGNGSARAPVVREWNTDGNAALGTETIGWSNLIRRDDGLKATVHVEGLMPGGVYTFWWVVPHAAEPSIPVDVFVALGGSAVVGDNGMATVRMRAHTGQAGIEGFPPLGGTPWHDLTDPMNSVVRVEVAYHGQADDAGDQLDVWQTDFWTGAACPPATPNPNPMQPHCPAYFAATHMP